MARKINETELIQRARAFFKSAMSAFQETYDEMVEDLNFINGEQWPAKIKAQREADDRPCLRINKLPQFVDRIHGDMRQARPSIKIRPVDDASDQETADVITGIIRNIETQSDSEIVYDSGGEAMARCGYGVWRVVSDYVAEDSFDQELSIERIKNQFSVIFDPKAKRWDRGDGRFCFVYEDMPRETYKAMYPNANPCGFDGGKNDYGSWATEDVVRVAEYYERDTTTSMLYFIHVEGEEEPQTVKELPEVPHTILRKRKVKSEKLTWYKINGAEIIEGPIDYPGKLIPVVPCYGKELTVEGKTHYSGIVRHAKDSMRLYNYYRSMDAETIALAPKAPWIMTAHMLGPYKSMWKDSNKRNFPYLLYIPDPTAPNARPERNIPQLSNQAVMQNVMVADQELHDTTGLQLASLGKKSNEKSGKAIEARAKEGDIGQFTYVDNQVRSIKYTAQILLEMIPYIYDTERVQRIIGEDGNAKTVPINQQFTDENDGKDKVFDLSVGKYDVTASVGPSYQTQRQESLAAMIDLANILDPPQRSVLAPAIVETSDWHGAEKIGKQLKKLLPPGIAEPEEGEEPEPPSEAELEAQAMEQARIEAEQEKLEVELAIKKAELKKTEAEAAEAEANAAIKEAEATREAAQFSG